MQTEVANYPAYKIFKREPNSRGFTEIFIADTLALKVKDYYITFKPSSVMSYFLEDNRDPIAGVERAIKHGHDLYWLTPQPSYISSGPRVQVTCTLIEVGMKVYFQGKTFEIVPAPNNNLNLKEI